MCNIVKYEWPNTASKPWEVCSNSVSIPHVGPTGTRAWTHRRMVVSTCPLTKWRLTSWQLFYSPLLLFFFHLASALFCLCRSWQLSLCRCRASYRCSLCTLYAIPSYCRCVIYGRAVRCEFHIHSVSCIVVFSSSFSYIVDFRRYSCCVRADHHCLYHGDTVASWLDQRQFRVSVLRILYRYIYEFFVVTLI